MMKNILNDVVILLSAAASPTMGGLVACFKNNNERNIRLIGIDMVKDPSVLELFDSFYQVPSVKDPKYVEKVLNICKIEGVKIYFPNISLEVELISKRLDEFEKNGIIVSLSNINSITISNNKLEMYNFLKKNGINIPQYFKVNSIEDFELGCKLLGYPNKKVCIKMIDGSGSRGVRIIDSNTNKYDIFINDKPSNLLISYDSMLNIL